MKILLACDDQSSVEKIASDLMHAGLPKKVEIFIFSVAKVYFPSGYGKPKSVKLSLDMASAVRDVEEAIQEAHTIAVNMRKQLEARFSHWKFHAQGVGGSPTEEILNKTLQFKPDLVVVGSHGRVGVGEFFFGSVAQKVLSESPSSVRVIRRETTQKNVEARIVIGVDGSLNSDVLIKRIAHRSWKKKDAVCLVTAIDTAMNMTIYANDFIMKKGWFKSSDTQVDAWIKRMHGEYKKQLQKAGLSVTRVIKEGDPKRVLIEEAKQWGADCIFLSATGHGLFERVVLGSVSTAVAARSYCSVEVDRGKPSKK